MAEPLRKRQHKGCGRSPSLVKPRRLPRTGRTAQHGLDTPGRRTGRGGGLQPAAGMAPPHAAGAGRGPNIRRHPMLLLRRLLKVLLPSLLLALPLLLMPLLLMRRRATAECAAAHRGWRRDQGPCGRRRAQQYDVDGWLAVRPRLR